MRRSKHKSARPLSQAYGARIWQRMRASLFTRLAMLMVASMVVVALLADFLANGKPLYARLEGKTYFPVVQDYLADLGLYKWEGNMNFVDWKTLPLEDVCWPPVRYSPTQSDRANIHCKSPFESQDVPNWRARHFLGTDDLGRDLLAGLIHGTRVSLTIGLVAVGIASLLGVLIGAIAGYYGDDRVKVNRMQAILIPLGLVLGWFYAFQVRRYVLRDALATDVFDFLLQLGMSLAILVTLVVVMLLIGRLFRRVPWLGKPIRLPLDLMLSRVVEVVITLPTFILLLTLASMVEKPSIYFTMVVIGFTSWPTIARYTRGEMLRTRSLPYIEGARALGLRQGRIILRHALPNSLAPVLVTISFGIASAILSESALSFLGLGVSMDEVTWGRLLQQSREDTDAWWLAVFPGMAIFMTVTCFNIIGESLREAMDPRLLDK